MSWGHVVLDGVVTLAIGAVIGPITERQIARRKHRRAGIPPEDLDDHVKASEAMRTGSVPDDPLLAARFKEQLDASRRDALSPTPVQRRTPLVLAAALAVIAVAIGPQSGGLGVGILCGSCAVGIFLLQATGLIDRYRLHQVEKLERKYRDKFGPD